MDAAAEDELCWLDGLEQAARVRARDVSPLELVELAIARIQSADPEIGAVTHRRFEQARAEAAGAPLVGPFAGVPFLVKDAVQFSAGDPYEHGLRALRDHPWLADHDSELLGRYRRAGFILLGRTTVPELTLSVTSESTLSGSVLNPWDPSRTAGGSSGGSAAAVAAGFVAVAHGNDMGGSIRIPAACCGLVGLKPSRDRMTLAPDYGEYWGPLTHEHVLTRSVRDSAAALDATAGSVPGDLHSVPLPARAWLDEVGQDPGHLRVGLLTTPPNGDQVDPECLAAVNETALLLEDLGHRIERLHGPELFDPAGRSAMLQIIAVGVARDVASWEQRLGVPIDEFEPRVAVMVEAGRGLTGVDLMNATNDLARWSRRIAASTGAFDVALSPTMACLPPRIGEFDGGAPVAAMSRVSAFVGVFNVSGQPAISLPLSATGAGLPIGVQLAAAHGRENILFRLAAQLEAARPWKDRRPTQPGGRVE